ENEIYQGKGQEHDRGPGKHGGPGDSDSDIDSEEPQVGHSRCRIQRTVSPADQKVRAVTQGGTKETRRLNILRNRRRHQRKELQKKKYRPEQTPKPLRVSLRDHKPG